MNTGPKTNGKVEILLAEDSPTQAAQLAHLLERHGYSVTTVANGREALALVERRKPTLVISDIVMPEMDGYRLCKAIKSDRQLKDIPVMLVTTLSDPQDVIRGLECGADNFLRKPYDERHLLSRIDYLLMNLELRKNQKMQMGMEINLGGQKHFISAERQQILDLLISTYEQAVELNSELRQRERELAHSNQVLNGLYRIADGLNHAASEQDVVELALQRALELPGIQAGWVSLQEGKSGFRTVAARNLPPALALPGVMEGDCACRRRLIAGELNHVTNILECERLGRATGDTHGLRYHASVPLWLGDRTLGVMNLVGPEKGLFSDDELRVLYGIGNQVAVALERAHLHANLERLVRERTAALEAEVVERQRIEREQARLVAIIEATPDMVATGDPRGHVLYYNRAGLQMLGFEPDLDPSTIRFLDTHPDWAAKRVMEEGIPHAIEHGTWSGETALLRRDGREVPVSQVIIAHKGPDGSVEYLSTIARDITLQKEHERRITRLNRVYSVLSGINTTIVRTRNRQELFEETCRIAVELGKFRLAWIGLLDTNGQDVTPVTQAGVDDGYLDKIQLTARDDAPDRCEMVALALRDNAAIVCNDIATDPQMARWRAEALRRGYRSVVVLPLQLKGTVVGLLLLYAEETGFFDTEEMRLLSEIAGDISFALDHIEADESRQIQSTALNATANAIVITDRSGTIQWVNHAFTLLTGYTSVEVLGKNPRLLKSGKHDPAFYQSLWETVLSGRTWHAEITNRRKDGSLYTEAQTITPVLGESGAIMHFVAIKEDITERLRLQEKLLQAQKMELVGQLAGGVAHDFNNQLCVILGWTGMALADLPPDHATRAPLDEIRTAGEAAQRLTRQLLAFSRQELVQPVFLSVNDLVADMERMLRRLIGEHIEFSTRMAPDIGPVKMDRGQLEQVLMNLVVNACDAMPVTGTLVIETANVELDDLFTQMVVDVTPGAYVLLEVSDTGSGMSQAVKARIFEPFFTTKARDKGTGLGLATCYGIVKQAGGHIAAYSEEGVGTTMKVYLPRRGGVKELAEAREVAAAAEIVTRRAPAAARAVETILLVEDEPAVRRVTTLMLEALGYRVVSASNGQDALRIVEDARQSLELLLTDVVLGGGMNGATLAERVGLLRPALKVLFASGYTSDATILHGLMEHHAAFAQKPFTLESLGQKVREVLDVP